MRSRLQDLSRCAPRPKKPKLKRDFFKNTSAVGAHVARAEATGAVGDAVLIPYGPGYLQLTPAEYRDIVSRGLVPSLAAVVGAEGNSSQEAERWLTSHELAAITGVGDTWWEGAAKRREVPHLRIGKALRFRLSELTEVLRS